MVPITVIPVPTLAAGAAVLLVAGNVLTSAPAAVAAQTSPAATLRADYPPG
jgi:hypothetical protein